MSRCLVVLVPADAEDASVKPLWCCLSTYLAAIIIIIFIIRGLYVLCFGFAFSLFRLCSFTVGN